MTNTNTKTLPQLPTWMMQELCKIQDPQERREAILKAIEAMERMDREDG